MTRRTFAAASLGLLLLLALPALPASAGGGCHGATTQGSGIAVDIANACFTPTVLHVDPGQSVTWTNTDPMVHNVTANGWGHFDDLLPGDSFSATFDAPGVYPFACTYHPGMSGAVVVGDGVFAGSGQTVSNTRELPTAAAKAATPASSGSGSVGAWAGRIALGFAAAFAIAMFLKRPDREGATP